MAVNLNPEISGKWWKEIAALGTAVGESIDEFIQANVAFLDDINAHADAECVRETALHPTLAAIGGSSFQGQCRSVAAYRYGIEQLFANAGTAIGAGSAKLVCDENAEEKALGVAAALGGLGAAAGLIAMGISPKPPIAFTSTTIPTDISMTMGRLGNRPAVARALAISASKISAPVVAPEGAVAVAGLLTGPTVMYAAGQPEDDSVGNNSVDDIDPLLEWRFKEFENEMAVLLYDQEAPLFLARSYWDILNVLDEGVPKSVRSRLAGQAKITADVLREEVRAQKPTPWRERPADPVIEKIYEPGSSPHQIDIIELRTDLLVEKIYQRCLEKGYISDPSLANLMKFDELVISGIDSFVSEWNRVFGDAAGIVFIPIS